MLGQLVTSNGCSSIQFLLREFYFNFLKINNFFRGAFFYFLSLESFFLKYKTNVRVESSISENIRKFRYARVLNYPFLIYKAVLFPKI